MHAHSPHCARDARAHQPVVLLQLHEGWTLTGMVGGLVGAGLAAVVVFGGVTTYSNVSTTDVQQTDPSSVPYADE